MLLDEFLTVSSSATAEQLSNPGQTLAGIEGTLGVASAADIVKIKTGYMQKPP